MKRNNYNDYDYNHHADYSDSDRDYIYDDEEEEEYSEYIVNDLDHEHPPYYDIQPYQMDESICTSVMNVLWEMTGRQAPPTATVTTTTRQHLQNTSSGHNKNVISEEEKQARDYYSKKYSFTFGKTSYNKVEKAAVLQETKLFHDLKGPKERPLLCLAALGRLLRLLEQADTDTDAEDDDSSSSHLSEEEATEIFFGITKLFQSNLDIVEDYQSKNENKNNSNNKNSQALRRMVYLVLKELLLRYRLSNERIMLFSCLSRDMMNQSFPELEARAIRLFSAQLVNDTFLQDPNGAQLLLHHDQDSTDENGAGALRALLTLHLAKYNHDKSTSSNTTTTSTSSSVLACTSLASACALRERYPQDFTVEPKLLQETWAAAANSSSSGKDASVQFQAIQLLSSHSVLHSNSNSNTNNDDTGVQQQKQNNKEGHDPLDQFVSHFLEQDFATIQEPLTLVILIRHVEKFLLQHQAHDENDVTNSMGKVNDLFQYCIQHSAQVVVYEAARAICNLVPTKTFVSKEITEAAVLTLRRMIKKTPSGRTRNKTSECAVHVVATRTLEQFGKNLLLTLQRDRNI